MFSRKEMSNHRAVCVEEVIPKGTVIWMGDPIMHFDAKIGRHLLFDTVNLLYNTEKLEALQKDMHYFPRELVGDTRIRDILSHTATIFYTQIYDGRSEATLSTSIALSMISCRLRMNCFYHPTSRRQVLYRSASCFNHNCQPNATWTADKVRVLHSPRRCASY